MKHCLNCKRLLATGVPRCSSCGSTSFYTRRATGPKTQRFPQLVYLPIVAWWMACLIPAFISIARETHVLHATETQLASTTAQQIQAQQEAWAAEQAKNQELLQAAEAELKKKLVDRELVSGALAARKRQEEWKGRLAGAPQFANSQLEATLLEMRRLGADPGLDAQEALQKAALLALPPGSKVDVKPMNQRYHVRVAFLMSALRREESGTLTQHQHTDSLRAEIQQLAAQVMKDLYASCGTRGIERLSVSCNHAVLQTFVPRNADPLELEEFKRRARVTMSSVYRVSMDRKTAAAVADWNNVPLWQMIQSMQVEKDGLLDLRISKNPPGSLTTEPNPDLEF